MFRALTGKQGQRDRHPPLLRFLPQSSLVTMLAQFNARPRGPAKPLWQPRRPSTSRYPLSPGCVGRSQRSRAAGPRRYAQLSPSRCSTSGRSAVPAAGPWAGPAAPPCISPHTKSLYSRRTSMGSSALEPRDFCNSWHGWAGAGPVFQHRVLFQHVFSIFRIGSERDRGRICISFTRSGHSWRRSIGPFLVDVDICLVNEIADVQVVRPVPINSPGWNNPGPLGG